MARSWVRVVLLVTALAAIAAAGLVTWSGESQIRAADAALRQAEAAGGRALANAFELRAAQQAYVALGQGEDFWFARVTALGNDLDEVLAIFKGHLSSPEAVAAVDEAAAVMQDFRQVDVRARDFTHGRQLAQASDVIFGDGFDVTRKLTAAIARGVTSERVASDADAAALRQREAMVLAGGAGAAAIVLLLLVPGGRREASEPAFSLALTEPSRLQAASDALDDLNDLGSGSWRSPSQPAVPVPPAVDLTAVAGVCSDLARIGDTRAIPALLERAAAVLDAAGIVLWIADPDGRELSPIVVHGYAPQMASRLGTIAREAANVTASAYRTGLVQTVKSDSISNGAIAAPLAGAAGCVGVMAIEMKNGGEQREPLLAAATIIASQLSTLVGPPSSRTSRAEAAG
jgi:hypothetical protein